MKWLDLRMMATLNEAPSSFTATFGRDLPQPEHPFEIYAVKMAAANLRTPDAVNENLLHL
jgi:hypothetical protein